VGAGVITGTSQAASSAKTGRIRAFFKWINCISTALRHLVWHMSIGIFALACNLATMTLLCIGTIGGQPHLHTGRKQPRLNPCSP
jgi:hypothetical protein